MFLFLALALLGHETHKNGFSNLGKEEDFVLTKTTKSNRSMIDRVNILFSTNYLSLFIHHRVGKRLEHEYIRVKSTEHLL